MKTYIIALEHNREIRIELLLYCEGAKFYTIKKLDSYYFLRCLQSILNKFIGSIMILSYNKDNEIFTLDFSSSNRYLGVLESFYWNSAATL